MRRSVEQSEACWSDVSVREIIQGTRHFSLTGLGLVLMAMSFSRLSCTTLPTASVRTLIGREGVQNVD